MENEQQWKKDWLNEKFEVSGSWNGLIAHDVSSNNNKQNENNSRERDRARVKREREKLALLGDGEHIKRRYILELVELIGGSKTNWNSEWIDCKKRAAKSGRSLACTHTVESIKYENCCSAQFRYQAHADV